MKKQVSLARRKFPSEIFKQIRHAPQKLRVQFAPNKYILYLLFLLLIPLTTAMQLSETSLEFSLEEGQTACKEVNFVLDSPSGVQDIWASNSNQQWSVTTFKTSAEELGISINYPKTLEQQEKKVQVCVSGSEPGEYRGALLFRQEQVGTSIVQFAVWLKVSISEKLQEDDSDSGRHSGSSYKSSSLSSGYEYLSSNFTDKIQELTPQSEEIKLNKIKQKEEILPLIFLSFIPIILIFFLIYLLKTNDFVRNNIIA